MDNSYVNAIKAEIRNTLIELGFLVTLTKSYACIKNIAVEPHFELIVVGYYPREACIIVIRASLYDRDNQNTYSAHIHCAVSGNNFIDLLDTFPGHQDMASRGTAYVALQKTNCKTAFEMCMFINKFVTKGLKYVDAHFKPRCVHVEVTPHYADEFALVNDEKQEALRRKYKEEVQKTLPPEYAKAIL